MEWTVIVIVALWVFTFFCAILHTEGVFTMSPKVSRYRDNVLPRGEQCILLKGGWKYCCNRDFVNVGYKYDGWYEGVRWEYLESPSGEKINGRSGNRGYIEGTSVPRSISLSNVEMGDPLFYEMYKKLEVDNQLKEYMTGQRKKREQREEIEKQERTKQEETRRQRVFNEIP